MPVRQPVGFITLACHRFFFAALAVGVVVSCLTIVLAVLDIPVSEDAFLSGGAHAGRPGYWAANVLDINSINDGSGGSASAAAVRETASAALLVLSLDSLALARSRQGPHAGHVRVSSELTTRWWL